MEDTKGFESYISTMCDLCVQIRPLGNSNNHRHLLDLLIELSANKDIQHLNIFEPIRLCHIGTE